MLRNESDIREGMIQSLKAQIEAVETDDEAQYLINNAKQSVYAYVLRMNEYGRDLKKEADHGKEKKLQTDKNRE